MKKLLPNFVRDEDGAALPEYAILLGLILAVAVAVLNSMGTSVTSIFSKVSSIITTAAAGSG
jgi:pilus assembly protein Flp/PilA